MKLEQIERLLIKNRNISHERAKLEILFSLLDSTLSKGQEKAQWQAFKTTYLQIDQPTLDQISHLLNQNNEKELIEQLRSFVKNNMHLAMRAWDSVVRLPLSHMQKYEISNRCRRLCVMDAGSLAKENQQPDFNLIAPFGTAGLVAGSTAGFFVGGVPGFFIGGALGSLAGSIFAIIIAYTQNLIDRTSKQQHDADRRILKETAKPETNTEQFFRNNKFYMFMEKSLASPKDDVSNRIEETNIYKPSFALAKA